MPRVLIGSFYLRNQPGRFRTILEEAGFELVEPTGEFVLGPEILREHLPQVEAMLAGGERLSPELIALAPGLRVIARTGVGYDLIDVPTATQRRIAVTITPGTNQESVAEQTMGLILALLRRIVSNDRIIHGGSWDRRLVEPVRGKTLGLIGLGRIGQAVATRAKAFAMRVLAFDPVVNPEFAARQEVGLVTLPELLEQSDIVSLHVPLTEATRRMVDANFLARMKPGSYLINTARGGIVDETALVRSLTTGHLAGAGLDVLNLEPPERNNPLLGLPHVILSPHIAGTDTQSMSDMADMAAQTVVDLYHNRWPRGCVVNEELREGWSW
jgi:D-3-phosphoglycerate dehydrogenase